MQAVSPATCFQLLGLPQETWHSIPRKEVQQDLVQAAAKPPASTALSLSAGLQSIPGPCFTSTALTVLPILDQCSLFFGQTNPQGQPVLAYPQTLPSQGGKSAHTLKQTQLSQGSSTAGTSGQGAMDICVGDAVDLEVEVHSSLPEAVSLKDLTLVLGLLQEVTVAYSPKSASSSRTDFSRTNSSLRHQKAASTDSPTATGIARTPSGDLTSAVTAAGADADVLTQWQETEELVCPLAQASTLRHAEASHSSTELQQLGGVQVTAGAAMLQPGVQRLVFRACPLKRGLYSLKHMTASLHQLALHIPALPRQDPHELDPHRLAMHQQAATHPVMPNSADGTSPPLGPVLNTGLAQQQTVVLNVHSCKQRVAVSAAAVKGALVAGQPQWLGISIVPMHDALHEACIHVGFPSQSRHGNAASSNPLAASLGSRSSNASSASHSLEDHVSAAHAVEFLHPDRAIAAPLQPEAVASCETISSSATATPPAQGGSPTAQLRPNQAGFTPMPETTLHVARSQTNAEDEMQDTVSDRQNTGREASTSGSVEESSWVSLEHNHGSNMPSWAATRPSLLWLWVQPGTLSHVAQSLNYESSGAACAVLVLALAAHCDALQYLHALFLQNRRWQTVQCLAQCTTCPVT